MIEVRNLTRRYGSTVAVDALSFDVRPGSVTGFLGPNGAGKSTTMRLILGMDRADAGRVRVGGRPYRELRWPLREVGALLEGSVAGAGYLLKERVADVDEFAGALERVAAGGTALDPEVVSQLLRASRRADGLTALTARERHVLALLAEGRSNAGIADALVVTGGTVEKHVGAIFDKLGLLLDEADNRRVLAVLRYLGA